MRLQRASKSLFVAFGLIAVLCAPAILAAEHFGLSDDLLHPIQLLAVIGCIAASITFLAVTRGAPFRGFRLLAASALFLAALWFLFVIYVLLTLDLGSD